MEHCHWCCMQFNLAGEYSVIYCNSGRVTYRCPGCTKIKVKKVGDCYICGKRSNKERLVYGPTPNVKTVVCDQHKSHTYVDWSLTWKILKHRTFG